MAHTTVLMLGLGRQGTAALHDLVRCQEVDRILVADSRPDLASALATHPADRVEPLDLDITDPVEVENAIQSHPKVYDVGVIGIPDERLGEMVTAIIDPQPGETITEEEITEYCLEIRPRYKRPRRIFFDKVPRNPTGKIEKPKLREKYAGFRESFKL